MAKVLRIHVLNGNTDFLAEESALPFKAAMLPVFRALLLLTAMWMNFMVHLSINILSTNLENL